MIDRIGMIWLPEHSGVTPTKEKRLLMFNPKTEKFEKMIAMDPDNVVRNSVKWLQSLAIDSKDNVYVGWIMGGALSKYDRATGKVSVFRLPDPALDRLRRGGGSQRQHLDRAVERREDREVRHPQQPVDRIHGADLAGPRAATECRLREQHLVGNLRVGQPARQAGEARSDDGADDRYTMPQRNSQPYDVAADTEGNIWFADSPAAGPRRGDWQVQYEGPELHVLSEAAVRRRHAEDPGDAGRRGLVLAARHPGDAPAISVLYPDMDKITTLGAYYVNGAPGYPFKVTPGPIAAAR